MKKVSIIVPVYNVEKYISKCIESLVNQTLKDIEIIIVNDGSPDNSQKIIDKYVSKYPKLVKSFIKENGGQGSARNYGLSKAKGEYISFVDSDDWLDVDALELMYSKAKVNNSDIVICDMVDHYSNYDLYHDCTTINHKFDKTPSACNKIFKHELIKQFKFLSKVWYEDFEFTTKVLMNTDKISVVKKGLYHCHCRAISTMNNNNSLKNLDMIYVIESIFKYAKENNFYDRYQEDLEYMIIHHVLLTTINRVSLQKSDDKKKVLHTLLAYCRKNVPNYKKNKYYKNLQINKKIIITLNYFGLYNFSKLLLKIKSMLKK